jgi:hypothetical protein
MKKSRASLQMVEIAKRIAAKNGVSVAEVLSKVERSAKKTSFRLNDFFWGDSVITLSGKNKRRRVASAILPTACGAVPRLGCDL